tara:strand:- start:1608 stop:1766 length:159 start_codon:yes stop_codon:yes gene_type:complete
MLKENTIRVQQTQEKKKLKKFKALIWKLIKGIIKIFSLIYQVWRLFEGEDLS